MWIFKNNKDRYYQIKSFSYFLPAPPKRTTGYQEKEFDRIIEHLAKKELELIDIQTQSHSHGESSGVWLFCRLGALSKKAASAPINLDYQEISGSGDEAIPMDPDIVHDS